MKKNKQMLLLGILAVVLAGCTDEAAPPSAEERKAYVEKVMAWREMKDEHFRESEKSPLLEKDKKDFKGLPYFPVNPALRLQVTLMKLENPEPMEMLTNEGSLRKAIRYGYFTFVLDNKVQRLYVYKFLDSSDDNYLFIPFRDATSGKESYPGGRYLDIEEQDSSRVYTLDFNMAYNPSCAYGRPDYICPVPPPENTLEVAIRAGEKKWH